MEAVMNEVEFTKEDLQKLRTMVAPGSVFDVELEDMDFDPVKFKEFMKQFPKEYKFLYQMDFMELPMKINDQRIMGWLNFRFSVGK